MQNFRFTLSRPISSRATVWCCRRARPPRRSSPRPRSPARSLRSATRTSIWPTARSRLTRRRSEEHTSELQSQFHLVCRLLLEKKKKMERGREKVGKDSEEEK